MVKKKGGQSGTTFERKKKELKGGLKDEIVKECDE